MFRRRESLEEKAEQVTEFYYVQATVRLSATSVQTVLPTSTNEGRIVRAVAGFAEQEVNNVVMVQASLLQEGSSVEGRRKSRGGGFGRRVWETGGGVGGEGVYGGGFAGLLADSRRQQMLFTSRFTLRVILRTGDEAVDLAERLQQWLDQGGLSRSLADLGWWGLIAVEREGRVVAMSSSDAELEIRVLPLSQQQAADVNASIYAAVGVGVAAVLVGSLAVFFFVRNRRRVLLQRRYQSIKI